MLITYGSQHIQHMQKALELLNVKLTTVVSDITGITGMAIIKARRDLAAQTTETQEGQQRCTLRRASEALPDGRRRFDRH